MADSQQVELIRQGIPRWNKWRDDNRRSPGPDLSDANLSYLDLGGADLSMAKLIHTNLTEASLKGTNLRSADLTAANLIGADLRNADLRQAYLFNAKLCSAKIIGAKLIDADLQSTDLSWADLSGADLTGAILLETPFIDTDLTKTQGLDTCRHWGPSTLDFRTLARSGPLPLAFLRGCGLTETFITYLPSILNRPIEFYSCFISYSTRDQEFAERLHADLQNKGVRCWFAPHDIKSGKKIHEQIDEAIRVYDRLLLILSDASMNSEWVKTEIAQARQKEINQKRQVLFPISLVPLTAIRDWKCFDGDTGKDSAREIREYFVPDFSGWKNHDLYRNAFDRLVRDLKAV